MNVLKNKKRNAIPNATKKLLAITCTLGMTSAWGVNLTVNNISDISTPGDGQCTLREAITNANTNSDSTAGDCASGSGTDTISFRASGNIQLSSSLLVNDVAGLTVDGVGHNVILNGNNAVRVIQINPGANFTMKNLMVSNGLASGGGFAGSGIGGGGGINNQFGNLIIDRCTFSGNTSTGNGGGIANYGDTASAIPNGNLIVTNSTFFNNSAAFGGAILNGRGKVWGSHLTVVGNSAITPICPTGSI